MYTYETNPILKTLSITAVRAEVATGYPAIVLITQVVVESAWCTKTSGDFNYYGIKEPDPEHKPAKFCPTFEDLTTAGFRQLRADERASVTHTEPTGTPGITRYFLSCWFASYADMDESVRAYITLILNNPRYHDAWPRYRSNPNPNPDDLIRGIAAAGYATGGGYEDLLLTVEHRQNIQHCITCARIDMAS